MGKLMKNGRPYGGHSTTAATVNYTDTHNIGATNTQDALDKVAQRVISQSAASGVSYTDTNNIGAANVQSAIDKLSEYSEGYGSVNSTYLRGRVAWQKVGRVVSVYCDFTTIANLPSTDYGSKLISGLPPILSPVNWIKKWTLPSTDNTKKPIILGTSVNSAFEDTSLYSTGNGNVTSGITYLTSFTYICK